ncbi:MAG: class I SAM-dependent methyltransferase [Bacteroidia bacterium]|nr:class I SAM-dependent methyltransferase [Bacteroidia bacterium]
MTNKEEWFSDWFCSPYYPVLYHHRDEEEAEQFLTWLMDYLNLEKPGKILDLACGRGRHSRFLNQMGYKVQGWDFSKESIKEAKKWENDNLRFLVHDMRKKFREKDFSAILNLFTSFGYFDNPSENEQVLRNIRSSLKPGGKFVLDYLNPEYLIPKLVPFEEKNIGNIHFEIKRYISDGFIIKEITIVDNKIIHKFKEKVQIITAGDFQKIFSENGFNTEICFGSYSGDIFSPLGSPRIITIATV